MSEKSTARYIQEAITADVNFEIPSYQTCLNLVRADGPTIRAALDGQPDFGAKYRAALVERARAVFRRKVT